MVDVSDGGVYDIR